MNNTDPQTYPLSTCEISSAVICGNIDFVKKEIFGALVRLSRGRTISLVDERLGTAESIDAMIDYFDWLDYLDWRHPGHSFRNWAENALVQRCNTLISTH